MAMTFKNRSIQYSSITCSLFVSSIFLAGCNNDTKDSTSITPIIQSEPLEVNVLHINDSHSHLDEESTKLLLETSVGNREPIQVSNGGFARVAALMNSLASTEKNPIKIHSGDAITGDLYFTLKEGEAEADLMNTVCFDTLTLGNHEFDNTDEGLKKFIGFLNNKGRCKNKTQVLSANVEFGKTSALYQTDLVKPYTIMDKEGQKIGLIGLTIADKTKNASRPNADTIFKDELTTAQNYIDQLKQQGINKIIVQSHLGYGMDKALAAQLSGVDVIVGGDSHTLLADAKLKNYGMSPDGNYPTTLKNKDGEQVCVVQAWQYAYVVGQLKVNFDANGKVQACTGKANVLIGDDFKRSAKDAPALNTTELDVIKKDIESSNSLRIVQPNTAALAILEPYKVAKNLLGKEIVANAQENLCLRRVPGMTKDTSRSTLGDICNKSDFTNQHGGDVQQLVAEAFLQQGKKYFNADISIQNGGGVRVDIPQGDISVEKIYTVLPFKNTLVQLKATGLEIKNVLEDAMDAVVNNNTGSYPYAGGLQWDVDLSKTKGQRISNLKVHNAQGIYEALNPDQTYQVITINFLADGQDFYSSFKNITGERRVEVGLDYAEAFLDYAKNEKVLKRLAIERYSTQTYKE